MKKLSVKVLVLVLVIATITVCALSFSACSNNQQTIGIIKFGEHDSLNDCYEGIVAGLQEGLGDAFANYKIDLQNSNFDASVSAAQANTLVSKNVALIGAIATPSAVAAASAAKGTIPVVYCAVSDPAAAGLSDMANVTGSSDLLDFDGQLALIKKFIPTVSKIGVLYTLGEANSISQIATLEAKANALGITIEKQAITNASEIPTATDTLLTKDIDCITNLTDNTVVGALDIIIAKTNAANIPVFGSEIDQVKNGCIASASLDYKALGKETGLIMAKILKGEVTASNDIAIQVKDSFNCYSTKVATALGIAIPEGAGQDVDLQA
ncbi:MAG: ABC transporter substrate-binding protein [Clostridiales bacterium]|nr:ABC transporter substrate-binding protein [Clostridiales bacterium]